VAMFTELHPDQELPVLPADVARVVGEDAGFALPDVLRVELCEPVVDIPLLAMIFSTSAPKALLQLGGPVQDSGRLELG